MLHDYINLNTSFLLHSSSVICWCLWWWQQQF